MKSLPLILLLTLALILPACTYVEEEAELVIPAFEFIEKVETQRSLEAWDLLSSEAQDKLSAAQLSAPGRDLLPVVSAFQQASLTTEADRTFNMVVENLGGEKGTVRIWLVEEQGQMKIANLSLAVPGEAVPIKKKDGLKP